MELCKASKKFVGYLACALVLGCGGTPTEVVDPDTPPPGYEEVYQRFNEYQQACAILEYLKCPEFNEMNNCEADMRTLVELNTFEKKNILCIRSSRTRNTIRRCEVDCRDN
jgi:hypothetical protein